MGTKTDTGRRRRTEPTRFFNPFLFAVTEGILRVELTVGEEMENEASGFIGHGRYLAAQLMKHFNCPRHRAHEITTDMMMG